MQMDDCVPMAVCNYHAFLSFRGPDTREDFIKYFKEQLSDAGIVPFVDSVEIEYGERIDRTIVKAIKRSSVCIPVFSKDFASSPACLMEVAQMVKSKKRIRPIFFGVEPGVVRHQQGTYKDSFDMHESKNRYPGLIEEWKAALKKTSSRRGPVIENNFRGCHEIKHFIYNLWNIFRMNNVDLPESLVGIDEYVPNMMEKLGFDYKHGEVVEKRVKKGRWVLAVTGMPGVGKTTLAWVLYKKISHFFEGCSFLEDVRREIERKGVVSLQERLIKELKRGGICPPVGSSYQGTTMIQHLFERSKVLIVLDDVDDYEQIKQLAELTWFGRRSRIILTSTRKNVYKVQKGEERDNLYEHEQEISAMEDKHALELFCKCAFGKNLPPDEYDAMSREIILAIGKLPYAIDILGRRLSGQSEDEWMRTLDKLRVELNDKVKSMLAANYELLSPKAKEVFLDIACFFTGVEKTIPCYMWAARDLGTGVDELQEKSLLKIGEENKFLMHGQLEFLGREYVKSENFHDPGDRTRLWDPKDVQTILGKNKVINKVIALRLVSKFNRVDGKEFHLLPHLRFLELDNVDIEGNPENLLPNLVCLDWRGCTDISKLFAFQMESLAILNLCSSSVPLKLQDWNLLMEKAQSLEVLNLKDCRWINASLEIPASSLLKCLILEGCLYIKPDETISNFENLVSLNLKHCISVKYLPRALRSMNALKELLIDGTNISELHFEEGSLQALETLSACECQELRKVTDSIGLLRSLRKLTLRSCKRLKTLPHVFGKLVELQEMDLSYTTIKELPSCVKDCKKLRVLKMVRTFLKEFPEAIKDLKELKELDFSECGSLSGLCDITGLFALRILKLKGTGISRVLARDERQFCFLILESDVLESDDGVTPHLETSQKKESNPKLNRKRKTQASQKNSRVSKHKKKMDEE